MNLNAGSKVSIIGLQVQTIHSTVVCCSFHLPHNHHLLAVVSIYRRKVEISKERRRQVSLVGILNFHHNLIAVPIITLRTSQHSMSSAVGFFSSPTQFPLGAHEGRVEEL